jgi:hypothetical protein
MRENCLPAFCCRLATSKHSHILRRFAEISQQKGGVYKQKCEFMCSFKIQGHILRYKDGERIANVFLRGTFLRLASSGTIAEEQCCIPDQKTNLHTRSIEQLHE